ncbi:MAG: sugar phosphate nucleotidyltransferase [bacterium]
MERSGREKEKMLTGAILAGGTSSRFMKLDEKMPKCLLPVGERSIIEHQLVEAKRLGIGEIHIVVGENGDIVRQRLGAEYAGINLNYLVQPEPMGSAHALGLLDGVIHTPFMLFLGDIFIYGARLESAADRSFEVSAVVVAVEEDDEKAFREGFAVVVDDRERVERVVEKPQEMISRRRGVGVYFFSEAIFDAVRRTGRSAVRDEYEITDSIQELIDGGGEVVCGGELDWDANLNSADDLLKCNLRYLGAEGKEFAIGDGAAVHPKARLVRSVLGQGAKVEKPVIVEDSVILDGVVVTESVSNMVIGENGVYHLSVTGDQD